MFFVSGKTPNGAVASQSSIAIIVLIDDDWMVDGRNTEDNQAFRIQSIVWRQISKSHEAQVPFHFLCLSHFGNDADGAMMMVINDGAMIKLY